MNVETLIPISTSMSGGFFIGALVGYFVKKIIKILMFVSGGIAALLLYLQQQQIISINMERVEESSTFILTSVVSSFDNIRQAGEAISLGIPLTGGFSAGLVVGFMKG